MSEVGKVSWFCSLGAPAHDFSRQNKRFFCEQSCVSGPDVSCASAPDGKKQKTSFIYFDIETISPCDGTTCQALEKIAGSLEGARRRGFGGGAGFGAVVRAGLAWGAGRGARGLGARCLGAIGTRWSMVTP